ncbi:DUF1189 domain-containing protein [Patescibacteria group bacterium]|nr:DUF1189 domain-containing protein [Patescibacteria group bacterium]
MRLRTYWHILKKTFSSPAYYLEVIKAPFWLSLKFFILSMILLGISWALRINQRIIPQLQQQSEAILKELADNYPENLQLVWTGERIEITPLEILEIQYPTHLKIGLQLPPRLAYLSPDEQTPEQFDEKFANESLFILTPRYLYLNDLRDSWTAMLLTELLPTDPATLSKETLPNYLDQVKLFISRLVTFTQRAIYIVLPAFSIFVMLWVGLIESIFMYLFFKFNQIKLNFKKTYQLSLHLMVVAETINQLTSWLYPKVQLPMFVLSFWIILLYIFWTQRKKFSLLKS